MKSSPTPPPRAAPHAGGESILVVEDEFLVRLLISDELRAAEYHVIEAVNAEEAIAILKSGVRVDLILTDVRMPGAIDGLDLLAFVRQTHPMIPVIITSGHLPHDTPFDAATAFLPKPYSLAYACELIQSRLESRQ